MKAELACYLSYRCSVLVLLRGAGLLHQEHGSQGSLTSVLGITPNQEGARGWGKMVSNGHCVHTGPMTQRRDDTQSGLTIPTRAEGMASENALGKISPGEKEE